MAKKRNSTIFDGLLNFLGGLVMAGIADVMEKKYHYTEKGKINPYAASAFGIGSGRVKNTRDLWRMGTHLGAAGSFDVDENHPAHLNKQIEKERRTGIHSDRDAPHTNVQSIRMEPLPKLDNKYAWRLNCSDGAEFGISPDSYETREQYQRAVHAAITSHTDKTDNCTIFAELSSPKEGIIEEDATFLCDVSLLDTGETKQYLTNDEALTIGTIVVVPDDDISTTGVLVAKHRLEITTEVADQEEYPFILGKQEHP